MSKSVAADQIAAVREFNRFYTRHLGVLAQHLMDSPYSLTEARVLFELAHRETPLAKEIGASLGLDAGYLSRIVQSFADSGLVKRTPSPSDRRQHLLALTAKGRAAYADLERRSERDMGTMLASVQEAERPRLTAAMATIERLLGDHPAAPPILRSPRPGDIGWVVQSHGAIYAAEYGFDASFEALVAEIAGAFLAKHDPGRERCWIAEHDGMQAGSLFLVRDSDQVAKLRLLLVTPQARGHRLGDKLLNEAVGFARQCGYRKVTLWTQSILIAARRLYQSAGFELVGSEPHRSFGQNLIGETWELRL
ncbi:bifunctional helix-turn-helix transcriptional regulator/GNAT family N-acetyltransferase [Rhodopseudomonas sp. HC1]|uniref:bifunctional helix-turn-helix transcriptional regulator/GNAT family N-acetyltransferase n=1 Tax=Rhodopseudomonas infernalis TaxID=2897386 RepID=UPI001EE7BCDE|nr:helix-turn-helix domain-containing GNAT family N-acetyltransferase [Rhodopseudomonas infernalis]MCG6207782.1 bifunctional helix-turn-helix transcriptional regulator/GNAT family N-acetyltransferase [Rhodopseudomonas infernalis]